MQQTKQITHLTCIQKVWVSSKKQWKFIQQKTDQKSYKICLNKRKADSL